MPDRERRDPGFCVVTPSYNQGVFIERTVRSVLDQGLTDLDYLVVDGGSDDETVEILRRYEGRLRFVSEPDEGQAHAVNKGLERTTGGLVGWLNSDDVYYPGALASVREYFARHPDVDVVYGDAHHIDEADAVIEPYYTEPWDPARLAEVCFLCQPAVFFRRRVVERCGLLDVRLHFCLDYEYWLRLARCGMRFGYLRELLAGSRLYRSNKTLGQRLRVHREINHMTRRRLGEVPDRWLSNFAHAFFEERGLRREDAPFRFALLVSLAAWLAALRWNGKVSRGLWRTTWGWIRGSRESSPAVPEPGRPLPKIEGSKRFRIGFDVSQTGTRKAGCGYLADSLIQALAAVDDRNEYVLYPTFGDDYWDPEGPEATRRVERSGFHRGLTHASHVEAQAFWRHPPADLEARLGHPDIVHSHNFFCPTVLSRARLVYTLHDLAFLVHPEWTTEHNRQICFEGVWNASLYADFVLANSEFTRRHFLETFPHYPEERTGVAYLASRFTGAAPVERPRSMAGLEPDRFFLSVGTLEPRKNQLRLVRAYSRYVEKTAAPMPLALVGGRGWMMEELENELGKQGVSNRVRLLGYVDDRELQWLYQSCFAFLYPSLFEGFGLPVAEALSQGAAVVTSRVTALPEVAGEAALFVDPEDEDEIARALERLTGDEGFRAELKRRAVAEVSRFSWRKTSEEVLRSYELVMSLGRSAHR